MEITVTNCYYHRRLQAGARGCTCTPLDSDLKVFCCAIAVIKINAGNAGIKSHNTEI